MPTVTKRENLVIVIGEYIDTQGQTKKRYKTIAELITMQGDDGSVYQFGEIWGPHGATKFNVYAQEDKQKSAPPQGQQMPNSGVAPQSNSYNPQPIGYDNT